MVIKHDNISESEFEDLNMTGTTFTNVRLFQSKFQDINFSESRFHNINFSDVQFTGAQIGGTLFKHIGPPHDKDGKVPRQRPVTFEEMMLTDSVFRKVDLSGVKIVDCDMTGMTIDGILVSDLIAAHKKLNS